VPKEIKKPKRSKSKYPGLDKKLTTRIRREYADQDYIHLLNDEQKTWLSKFNEEELNTAFKNDGTDFNKTKEERKKIYDRNNTQNRCLLGNLRNKANTTNNHKLVNYDNVISDIEDEMSRGINPSQLEDAYVEYLEFKEIEEFLEEYDVAMASFSETNE
jgi:hypothetical protein